MLKSLLTCDRDLKEAAMIERRRLAEEERKKRFFDQKQRILGIDCEGLNQQLLEKEHKLSEEREQAKREAEELKRNVEIAEAKAMELHDQQKQSEIELNEYRKRCQQKKDANEYDLNDPDGKKKALAARMDDIDPRLSVSGGQLFIGEDLTNQNRLREQKRLQKEWLDQQIAERRSLEKSRMQSEELISMAMFKHDNHAVSLTDKLNNDKRHVQRQIREYNESLALQKRENDKKRREMEQQDNLAEIYNFLSSDLLKETQPNGSNLGPNRCIPYMRKASTPEEIEKFEQEKELQLIDIQRKKMEQEQIKEEWDELSDKIHREMTLKERALSRKIKNMNHEVREFNQDLAKEQNLKIQNFEKVVNTNCPSEKYFQQFNTSSR